MFKHSWQVYIYFAEKPFEKHTFYIMSTLYRMQNFTLTKMCNLQINDIQKLDYAILLYKRHLSHSLSFLLIQETVFV